MEFVANYGLFFIKTLTLVLAILLTALGVAAIASKGKDDDKDKLNIKKLNEQYEQMQQALDNATLDKHELKQKHKLEKKRKKAEAKDKSAAKKRKVFVLQFNGDIKASAVNTLRQEITAILTIAKPNDEVVVKLESPGGMVHAYGLAASQLHRLREKQIPLTVCVDKVAASGGYLMACVADKILAAPFAIIGSVGVIAQLPNFNRFLKKHNIDYEQMTAGEYKRTLTVFGENTNKARQKFKEDLEDIHDIFKDYIRENRPKVNIDKIATGEHWLAKHAFELQLVDQLTTSDNYLLEMSKNADLYEVCYTRKKSLAEKLTALTHACINSVKTGIQSQDDLFIA